MSGKLSNQLVLARGETQATQRIRARYGMRLNSLLKRRVNEKHEHLKAKAFGGLLLVLIVMGALLFLPAGTLNYWQAWAFLAVFVLLLMMLTTIWRLFDEEKFLKKNLPGYTEYTQKVRYRLIPFVW